MLGEGLVISILAWTAGIAIVTMFSWNFFNSGDYYLDNSAQARELSKDKLDFREPLLPIYATSRWRYRKWFLVFLSFNLALYVLMAFAIGEPSKVDSQEWYKSYSQIFAAFLISGLVNVLPKNMQFLDILRWARHITHMRAKIPGRARSIFSNIMSYDMTLTDTQIESAISHVGSDYLKKQDFLPTGESGEQNTIEKNWAKACHLFNCINTACKDANSRYAYNINGPELVYEQALHNFEIIKDDIKNYNANEYKTSPESLKERTRLLLKQVSQLFVCLVFSSETREEDIFKKLRDTGVNLRKRVNYELNIPTIGLSMLGFTATTWISVFILAMFTNKSTLGASTANLICLSAVLIICAPIMITFFIKTMSPEIWPVRGQHSENQNLPPLLMFVLGTGMGFAGFYAMSYTPLFGDYAWYRFWPYTFMAGAISAFTAIIIDLKPRIVNGLIATKRAALCGVIALFGFVVIAVFAIIVVGNLKADFALIKQTLIDSQFIIGICAAVGFLSGVIISYISDYSIKLKDKKHERLITLSSYLLPRLGYADVAHLNHAQLNQKFSDIKPDLPNSLIKYLKQIEFIDNNESLPVESVKQLKSDMRNSRELETA